MEKIAIVAINGATHEYDRQYHYHVPGGLSESLLPGMRVIVPFGKGDAPKEGFVLGFAENPESRTLKRITKVVDERPVLTQHLIELAIWMKEQYFCTYGAAIKCMLPAGIGLKGIKVACLVNDRAVSTPGQKEVIDAIKAAGGTMEIDELKKSGVAGCRLATHIRTLVENGAICVKEQYTTLAKEKNIRMAALAMSPGEVSEDIEKGAVKRIQQIRVLEILMENGQVAVQDLARFASVSVSVLDTLCRNGYIRYVDVEARRDPAGHREVEETMPMEPTAEQLAVLEAAKAAIDRNEFSEILLHGVTGSGKTEVYMQLIGHLIEKGRQAIVLVPEISLTPQMADRFRGRFGGKVCVLHSRLSIGERYDQWRMIRDGKAMVAVGARSAVFAPFENLGAIIIDEEHESSYRSETLPRYSAARIAEKRCRMSNALLMYGSATPSIDTYMRAANGEIKLFAMKNRANSLMLPEVLLVDMRRELEAGNRSIFSGALRKEIERNLSSGQQTILFLNKRGYASFALCRSCGIRLKCRHCSITMTYHSDDDRLICHYCGYTVKMPKTCPKCGSAHIRQFGIGTQKVEEELKRNFPGCSAIRMDMDTTTGKHSHEEILDAFRENNINFLVGTQMIAKGHDFPNVTLVGVLAADSMLGINDFRASERTFQLLTQVSGRAGRGRIPGRVVIQTYNVDDYSIAASVKNDYEGFFRQEVEIRKKLRYPPFTNIACLLASSADDRTAFDKAMEIGAFIKKHINPACGDELLPGPMRAPVAKLKGRYRWRLVIKCDSHDRLVDMLQSALDYFRGIKGKGDVELSVDINPTNMM